MARIDVDIELRNGFVFSRRRIEVLEAVDREGSIAAAAKHLGVSYRGAWQFIAEMNAAARDPLIVAASGGRHGGGARLTPSGFAVLDIYRSIERNSMLAFSADLNRLDALTDR